MNKINKASISETVVKQFHGFVSKRKGGKKEEEKKEEEKKEEEKKILMWLARAIWTLAGILVIVQQSSIMSRWTGTQ
jgi:hypothetical protein